MSETEMSDETRLARYVRGQFAGRVLLDAGFTVEEAAEELHALATRGPRPAAPKLPPAPREPLHERGPYR